MASGDINAGRDIHAQNIITGIQQNFTLIFQPSAPPPPDLAHLRAAYLAYLRDSYRHLDMKGLRQVGQVTQPLSLAAVYVPLKASGHPAGPGELAGRVAGRALPRASAGETPLEAGPSLPPRLIEEALRTAPAVVVLGDPGAGKSTLLKVLALALAEQADGPLPILLPLNAYARRLQQGAINLSHYLGEYYAGYQHRLAGVGELFHHALSRQQAVVLLDGLDEVQAQRQHLVRLVQDFVNEHLPPSPEGDRPAEVVRGNRLVVTSRIVGYEEAPLAGRQWQRYTLTDFSRADIEQFIGQWTRAFALSGQGETEPARQAAERERRELLAAIFSRPSVERLAANPLLLTILALIKYTGVLLPEQRVKLYELYLQALIESWNLARSLDQYPVGPGLSYEETVQVLAPLALWLRRENPISGLVSQTQLESWLTGYFHGPEWGLPKGEARQRGRDLLDSVQRYSNLLLERGGRQYGFLHLTLGEMPAAKGIAQGADDDLAAVLALFEQYLPDPAWTETLQLAVGVIGLVQQRPKTAGALLQHLLTVPLPPEQTGRSVVMAGEILLDAGQAGVGRPAALKVTAGLVETMQAPACPIRFRREAGHLLGRLGWLPEPEPDDLRLAPAGLEPTGLDAFRRVELPGGPVWLGKYPVTCRQFARFLEAGGYDHADLWSAEGWAWRTGETVSQSSAALDEWLHRRPPEKRDQPYFWDDPFWTSPLYPVVGVTWFEAEAYARWLTGQLAPSTVPLAQFIVRLPVEAEWAAAVGGRGESLDRTDLNCAEAWSGRPFKDDEDMRQWWHSDPESWREVGLTAVTTFPRSVSPAGVWDGRGNAWEWMRNNYRPGSERKAVRGGSWFSLQKYARVSYRYHRPPDYFNTNFSFRVVVAPD